MKTIFFNGDIVTMEEEGGTAEAICVEDGVITRTGSVGDVFHLRDGETELRDLEGRAMFPGFIDGHSHFTGVANSLRQADLSGAESFGDIVEILLRFKKENHIGPGQWIVGGKYDHNFLEERRHPDRLLLDRASRENPVLIAHVSSHMGVANTMALKEMGITGDTPDPEGGRYSREAGSAEPDGYMEENAFIGFQNRVPMIGPDEMMNLLDRAQDIYAGFGITTVQEGMTAGPLMRLLRHAASQERLRLDVAGYVDLKDSHGLMEENRDCVGIYRNRFKIGGYKIFLDGSPQGRTAWMLTPYLGEEKGYCGYPTLTDQELCGLIETAVGEGIQLLAHCNGDAAAEQYIAQFEKVMAGKPGADSRRPVMIHAQLVREEQLARMIPLGMTPSFFMAHTYYWGDIHIENFGKERADKISPAGSAEKLGLPYTLHQDSPVLPPDMMKTVWCAVNRKTKNGISIGEEERIGLYEAMKAITVNGARQYFEEEKKGTISEGKLADLVILDRNPLRTKREKLADIKVTETLKEGVCVYKRK